MIETNKKFSINDVVIDRNVEDKDFAIAEIWALSEGNNSHHNPFSREVLERDAHTFKGKFIIGKYNKFISDTEGHEIQEDIYGYVSVTDEPQFKLKVVDGVEKEFVVVKAILSKIYAKEIVDMFNIDNKRSVSCEFSCALMYDEDEYGRAIDEDGVVLNSDNPILGYSISGITILGKRINPSVKGADMVMKKFSEDTNKLKLETIKSKEDNMEENKEFSEKVDESKDEDIVMEEPTQIGEEETKAVKGDTEVDEIEGEVEDKEVELSEEESTEDKEMACGESKEMGCGKDDNKEMSCVEEKEMSEQPTEETVVEEKSFSEQAKEFAEEEYKDFVEKLFSYEMKDFVEQVVELKKFMDNRIKSDTEKRFSEIMVEPKLCLGEKAYNVLFEEGKTLGIEELDAFEAKVKAFCEDAPKKQEQPEEEFLKFSCGDTTNEVKTELSVDELIEKYSY